MTWASKPGMSASRPGVAARVPGRRARAGGDGRAARFELFERKPDRPDMAAEVLRGLRSARKSIPPKYFYDAAGSKLFDAITELPEYYPTRTEIGILQASQAAIGRRIAAGGALVEYGSGSSVKVRLLLDACQPAAYVPVDISKEHLARSARTIFDDYPALSVYPTCADYTKPFELPPPVRALPPLAFFPGSSIGNFEPQEADGFLAGIAALVGAGGHLVIGVDAKKEPAVLERAYNDAAGVTAAFNRNLLRHVNAALGADFEPAAFDHRAVYNATAGRIEMYLDARCDQVVAIGGETVAFARGEALHTENSYKYAPDEFIAKAAASGFDCVDAWLDRRRYFMVLLLRARG